MAGYEYNTGVVSGATMALYGAQRRPLIYYVLQTRNNAGDKGAVQTRARYKLFPIPHPPP